MKLGAAVLAGLVSSVLTVTPAFAGDDACDQGFADGFCSEYDECSCSDCEDEPACDGGSDERDVWRRRSSR